MILMTVTGQLFGLAAGGETVKKLVYRGVIKMFACHTEDDGVVLICDFLLLNSMKMTSLD